MDALNVTSVPAFGAAGMNVNAATGLTFVGSTALTATCCVAVPEPPRASVTVKTTVNVPAVAKA